MNKIWAIVLAAGESKRMGSPKMLLNFNGTTMIEAVIGNILQSVIKDIIVVLGSDREKILPGITKMPVRYCYNDNYVLGMFSSVQCGCGMLPSDLQAVLIFPGDQPLIGSEVINSMIEFYKSQKCGIVVPVCNEKRGHPLLLDKKYINEILTSGSGESLRTIIERHSSDIYEVEAGTESILIDIDTKEDYLRETTKLK